MPLFTDEMMIALVKKAIDDRLRSEDEPNTEAIARGVLGDIHDAGLKVIRDSNRERISYSDSRRGSM